jgi:hypothetical protein
MNKNFKITSAFLILIFPGFVMAAKPHKKLAVHRGQGQIKLDLARARYSDKDFAGAIKAYQAIPSNSAQYEISREELAWSYLQAGDPLIPLNHRLEGRVLSAISHLHSCEYDQVQNDIRTFQKELMPHVKKIDEMLSDKKTPKVKWNNEKQLALEAITKMRFVKVELLSQIQRMERLKAGRDILAEAHHLTPQDERLGLNEVNNTEGSKWVFPAGRDLWSDELFKLRGLPNSQCEMLKEKTHHEI